MKIILVRHGRPDENDAGNPGDPSLNADGQWQAEATARLLSLEAIDRIIASPLRRARLTAEPLARQLGRAVDVIDGWAEADRFSARYRSTETLRNLGDEEWQRFLRDPIRYLGGDPDRFKADVLGALSAVARDGHPKQTAAIFTHGMPINVVLSQALGLNGFVHFLPGYGSITRLRLRSDGGIGIVSINESGHHALLRATATADA
jgi:broad specificity phosphatase PhoE